MKIVLKPLAKIDLTLQGLIASASAKDTTIQKKVFESGLSTFLISTEEMNDIIKIFKSLEESSLLIKCVSETIKNEAKGKKWRIL